MRASITIDTLWFVSLKIYSSVIEINICTLKIIHAQVKGFCEAAPLFRYGNITAQKQCSFSSSCPHAQHELGPH